MRFLTSPVPRLAAAVDGLVGRLMIDNPARRNAIDLAMWQALPGLIAALAEERDVRVIVLGAREGAFSAGADISEFATARATPDLSRAYEAENVRAFEAVMACPCPVIAAISGFCFGAGAGLALSCDLRVAAEDASFAIPAARLGVAYPPRAFAPIVAAIGPARTKELFFTGRRVDAAEALALGMLNRVVPKDALARTVDELAASIAAGAPMTHTATKRAVDAAAGLPVALPAVTVQALADACFDSADALEGRAAFAEKRAPRFSGR
jgi:enoyl-CoA hydratase/carnithine racemase